MSLPIVKLDFSRTRRRLGIAPLALMAVGVGAMLWVLIEYRMVARQSEGLQIRVQALAGSEPVAAQRVGVEKALLADAGAISSELATPWAHLLEDLESASRDSQGAVAVLAIEPDRQARRVRLVAEARSLPAALTYVQRLQKSKALGMPLLDSHEVRTDVQERPVRVQITAVWRLTS